MTNTCLEDVRLDPDAEQALAASIRAFAGGASESEAWRVALRDLVYREWRPSERRTWRPTSR